tara:strand:+ start:414 stop:662 length:249 start_codon:yes stop_codon:yes gene_type:complete
MIAHAQTLKNANATMMTLPASLLWLKYVKTLGPPDAAKRENRTIETGILRYKTTGRSNPNSLKRSNRLRSIYFHRFAGKIRA